MNIVSKNGQHCGCKCGDSFNKSIGVVVADSESWYWHGKDGGRCLENIGKQDVHKQCCDDG